jgi:hypothetical protein
LLDGGGPFDTACFHAQQAVEKYLKGVILLADQPFPFTHDLKELQDYGGTRVAGWPFSDLSVSHLTAYAVQLRYDSDFWPDRQQVVEALGLVEEVRSRAMAFAPKEAHP